MVDLVAFGVIMDDIVYPDGSTRMGVLGGGGPQTAFGMRLWSPSVGIVAGIGTGFSAIVKDWANESSIDGSGLLVSDVPTPRAWQLLEHDERRTQVWRVPLDVVQTQLGRSIAQLPDGYRKARGFHLGIHPDEPDLEFIEALRELGCVISIEPFKPADRLPDRKALETLLSRTDIFSTNQLEARSLVGGNEPLDQARRLLDGGASIVVLRLGSRGSIILDGKTGAGYQVPVVPGGVVDPVGAGNAYCGAFIAGWVQSRDLKTAGLYGSVAASFLVEQIGVPVFKKEMEDESRRRIKAIEQKIESI